MYSNVFKSLRRSAAWTALLCAATATSQAQAVLSTQHGSALAHQPFSMIDEALTRAADTLLLPAPPIPFSKAAQANAVDLPVTPGPRIDSQPRSTLSSGLTVAAARLDLLRPAIEPILRNRGVPTTMAAVIVVESGGRSTALSPKGARGLWQLMPDTARRYGLRVDPLQDDRVDLFKATDAAARYLHDLYTQFGDWKLALAAYNAGEANVGAAIIRAHSQDFDQLTNLRLLPLETRNYVPRVLATVQVLGLPLTLREPYPIIPAVTVFALSKP